jgi:hypothetical protein
MACSKAASVISLLERPRVIIDEAAIAAARMIVTIRLNFILSFMFFLPQYPVFRVIALCFQENPRRQGARLSNNTLIL